MTGKSMQVVILKALWPEESRLGLSGFANENELLHQGVENSNPPRLSRRKRWAGEIIAPAGAGS